MGLFAGTKWDVPVHCETCHRLESECNCPPPKPEQKQWLSPEKQSVKIALQRRKKGKIVTVIGGLDPRESDLPSLLTALKNTCGAGGAIEDNTLEVQGSHVERIQQLLSKMGYRTSCSKT